MCLIVDSNSVCDVFLSPKPRFKELNAAIFAGKAKLVYGGELAREYQRIHAFWRLLYRLEEKGSARPVADTRVDTETRRIRQSGLCVSDDPHIVALARVAQVRLLCSTDNRLCTDFKNRCLLSRPRGRVYRNSSHRALLATHCRD